MTDPESAKEELYEERMRTATEGIMPRIKQKEKTMLQTVKPHDISKNGAIVTSIHAPGVAFGLEMISPSMAERWLKVNLKNRRMKPHSVAMYAADMANGDWQWNGSAIVFDEDGGLIDGQNRLQAIIRSDKSIVSMVVRGLPRLRQRTIDTGSKRSVADDLKIAGKLNVNAIGATAKLLCAVVRGFASGNSFSKAQVHRMIDAHPDLEEAVRRASTKQIKKINVPVVAAWYYCAKFLLQDDAADEALEVLETGRARFEGDAIQAFMMRFIGDSKSITRNERLRLAGLWTLFKAFDDSKMLVSRQSVKLIRSEYRLSGLDYGVLGVNG